MFTADQVWGCAIAADRINGGYFKEEVVVYENECRKVLKEANKMMVKAWLRTSDFIEVTAQDIEQGRVVRHFFNGFLLKELAGKINDFERQALKIAQKEEFTNRDMLDFAIVSCLPAAMLREQAKKEVETDIRSSTQLQGEVGDKIQGDIEVVKCHFNQNYNRFRVTAKLGDAYVDFWAADKFEGTVSIKAKIKSVRGDKTTQIHYVKRVG
jgi:hypothetical protein